MPVNSSAFDDLQDSPDMSSSNSSTHSFFFSCVMSTASFPIIMTFSITSTLLIIPLSVFILCLGFQQCCFTSATATMSQSDLFTYNMVVMGLIEMVGSILCSTGLFTTFSELAYFGSGLFCITWAVKLQFHTLTCVERYLAVVHPITYLHLKSKNGERIRNVNIGCIWLLLLSCMGLVSVSNDTVDLTTVFILLALAVIVICFCSISVLCALRRPGPGEAGRDKLDKTKKRAFFTILTIFATLSLSLLGILLCNCLYLLLMMYETEKCMIILSAPWFTLPCSVVLPLLYLHRAGKLPSCTQSTKEKVLNIIHDSLK